jgi:hypothetical protein
MPFYKSLPAEGCVKTLNCTNAKEFADVGGVVTGASTLSPIDGLNFTGTAPSNYNIWNNGGSIRFKFKINDVAGSNLRWFFYGLDANRLMQFGVSPATNAVIVEIRNGAGNNYYQLTFAMSMGVEHDLIVTWNPATTTLSIYLDGAYMGGDSIAGGVYWGSYDSTFNTIKLGAVAAGSYITSANFKYVKIYNRVITAQEALDYYTGQTFNYEKRATCILPMTADCHDATNNRTLDAS